MSLIPFILDLAEELHEFNRCLGTGMDVDDFGFGIYPPQELQHQHLQQLPSLLRRPRTVSQLYWLPSTKQRPHPYHRSKAFCSKSPAAAFVASEVETPRESAATNGAGQEAASASGATAAGAKSAYSVVNKNGFQVSMNVKQFAPNELTVKTIDNCIVVEGQHEDKEDGHGVISRHFIRKYMLPKGYDPAEVLSTLSSDGILTVKAPPPPATKTDKPLEHIVDIQQTGPANLSVKETSKEQTKSPSVTAGGVRPGAAITTATASQQQQQELQKVNEHNGNGAADSNNIHAAGVKPTAVEDVPETEEMPMCANNNSVAVVAPAAIDAIVAAAAADEHNEDANANIGSGITATTATNAAAAVVADTATSVSGESNGGIAVVPMELADIPDCSDVAVAMETETTDVSETSTTLFEPVADGAIAVAETKGDHTDGVGVGDESSAVPENLVVASAPQPLSTAADLVVAADAAILLAKTHCHSASSGENGNKAAAIPEEVAN